MLEVNSFVKLINGSIGKITGLPTGFLSNGSYSILLDSGKTIWVKPDEILYKIDRENFDDIDKYLEFIYDGDGIHIVPKNTTSINIMETDDHNKMLLLELGEENKHKKITIYLGELNINENGE